MLVHTYQVRATRSKSRASGTTIIEVGFVLPIFLLLVFGMVEIGRAFMVSHLLSNAARNGCRIGVLPNKANSDITSSVNSTLAGQVSNQTTTVTVNGVVADASTANSGDQITVTVSVTAANVTWLPAARYLTGTLSADYALRRE